VGSLPIMCWVGERHAPAWRLEESGGKWQLVIQVASEPVVDLSADCVRLKLAADKPEEEPATLQVPQHALPIDVDNARCKFSRRRSELLVEWPCQSVPSEAVVNDAAEETACLAKAGYTNDQSFEASVTAEEWKVRGNESVKSGDLEEAIKCYSAGLSVGGGDEAALHSNRAMCLYKLARHEECLEDAKCCVSLRPEFFKGYVRGALALRAMGKPEEALLFLKRCPSNDEAAKLVAELRPEADAAESNRIKSLTGSDRAKEEGNVLFRKGLFESALSKYSDALELCQDQEGALALSLRNNRAACYHQLSDYSAVVREASFVLEREPSNLKARVRRMLALEPLERLEAALQDAQEVLKQDPRHEMANKVQHRLGKLVRDMYRSGAA